jgi:hypothetical protein
VKGRKLLGRRALHEEFATAPGSQGTPEMRFVTRPPNTGFARH